MSGVTKNDACGGFCEVRLLDVPLAADHPYSYAIPPHLVGSVTEGTLVHVPFGRGDRVVGGVVTATLDTCAFERVKHILSLFDEAFHLTKDMMGMCRFLAEHTLCTLGEAVKAVLPPGALDSHATVRRERTVYPLLTAPELEGVCNGVVRLRSAAHRAVLQFFTEERGVVSQSFLCEKLGVTPAQIKPLVERGYLAYGTAEVIRNPYEALGKERDTSPIYLSRAQTAAFDSLLSLYRESTAKAGLLFGVTGSGKTKVMMRVIDTVIAEGKQVIMMVPEISLTPQTVSLFCRRYGTRVAVIHSALSQGERYDAWRRIRMGEVDLVIGTRSAVFAPLSRIGAIIIDEEHEHTYKSESDPKYHARDVAAYRCGQSNALLLLASATPSFESFHKAKEGKYTLIPLRERYGGATLPEVEIIDMRQEIRRGKISPFSERLTDLLISTKAEGEQAILFLNRRGYNTSLQCKECGEPLLCPHCSVALTYHVSGGAEVRCHCCGYRSAVPKNCPSCGSMHIAYVGFGTQKAESDISLNLPGVRVMRMDADTTAGKMAHDRLLEGFRKGEADVLLGTQMVTKGHDFPRVTLVGVLLADTSLYASDFRAAERTFSQLTQVIGRAGRATSPGIAVVQTFSPANDVIRYASRQDYESFYESEIALRKSTMFPPFCDIAAFTLVSGEEQALFEAAEELRRNLGKIAEEKYSDLPLVVFGPFEAKIYKAAEKFRMQMMVKCRLSRRTRGMFCDILLSLTHHRKVSVGVDFNPL